MKGMSIKNQEKNTKENVNLPKEMIISNNY